MDMARAEGDFSAELLAHTVREDAKRYEAALATIKHPGHCDLCRATLIVKQWRSRRNKIVNIKTYCPKCEPWG